MKRRLFNAGALVSLVLLSLLTGLWIRSYWKYDVASWGWGAVNYKAATCGGRVIAMRTQHRYTTRIEVDGSSAPITVEVKGFDLMPQFDPAQDRRWRNLWTFSYGETPFLVPVKMVVFPLWVAMLPLVPLPGAWLWRRTHLRVRANRCPACGYDLRGTPGSKTCPECASRGRLLPTSALPADLWDQAGTCTVFPTIHPYIERT